VIGISGQAEIRLLQRQDRRVDVLAHHARETATNGTLESQSKTLGVRMDGVEDAATGVLVADPEGRYLIKLTGRRASWIVTRGPVGGCFSAWVGEDHQLFYPDVEEADFGLS